jgi:hypothetical protein
MQINQLCFFGKSVIGRCPENKDEWCGFGGGSKGKGGWLMINDQSQWLKGNRQGVRAKALKSGIKENLATKYCC